MLTPIFRDLLIFVLTIAGLGLPAWRWFGWAENKERLSLAMATALLIGAHATFSLYLAGLPLAWLALLSALGLGYSLIQREAWRACWHDHDTRRLLGYWLVLALWCLGLHSTILSYSGAAWAGDWVEHYDRAQFFLSHWPTSFQFLERYPLPARPPLTNWFTAGLLAETGGAFYHYQIITTLLSTLVIFPLSVLVKHWRGGANSDAFLLLLLMASPLFLQNATFPWTKLSCAFFILLAITQWMPTAEAPPTRQRLVTGAALLAAGLLAHYSAAPWIIALVAAGAWIHRAYWRERSFKISTASAFAVALIVCLPWFSWALATYGAATTFTANTAVQFAPSGTLTERLGRALGNIAATFSPRSPSRESMLQQSSVPGGWRDFYFVYYQLRLPWALGTGATGALLWLWLRSAKASIQKTYWRIVIIVAVGLGIISHSPPDNFGLTHIALQPLVLLGLAYLCSQVPVLPRWVTRLWFCGAIFDFLVGVLLHFGLQSCRLARWENPSFNPLDTLVTYAPTAYGNWMDKSNLHLIFLAEVIPPPQVAAMLLVGFLTASLLLARLMKQNSSASQA